MQNFHKSSGLLLFLLLALVWTDDLCAQEKVFLEEIIFEGQKRTRDNVIRRELTFQVGDSLMLKDLPLVIEENRQRIQNTNLFSKVEANVSEWTSSNSIKLTFSLREQWYLTGYWIFDLADRNFNVWWEEQNHKLNRVNYGFRLNHKNLTGNADEISVGMTLGYTRRVDLEYFFPGINKERTLGLRGKIFYAQNRETNYTTKENKFQFFDGDDFQLRSIVGEFGLQYRKNLDVYHKLDLEFHHNESSDTLAKFLNPDFFLKGTTRQRAFALAYSLIIDKRKERPYTKKGWYLKSVFRKDGLGIFNDRNAITLTTTGAKYFEFSPKWSLELIGKIHFYFNRQKQPYYNSRSFGSIPDFLSGYELYVVDGMDFSYLKSSIRYQLLDWEWDFKMIDLFQRMRLFPLPLQIYLTLNNDAGYVNDPFYSAGNSLSNQPLWGGGIGVDIVAYYDKTFQIQYSFNHLLENGIFLHFKDKF